MTLLHDICEIDADVIIAIISLGGQANDYIFINKHIKTADLNNKINKIKGIDMLRNLT